MIIDLLKNYKAYPYGSAWQKAFKFLTKITPQIKEGEYEIQGQDIFARVMSYETVKPQQAKLEGHRKYIDIQMPLSAPEGIAWHPRANLKAKTIYQKDKDVLFYYCPKQTMTKLNLYPKTFAVFFPEDIHMPKLIVGTKSQLIKKVVIKLNKNLLTK